MFSLESHFNKARDVELGEEASSGRNDKTLK